MKGRAPDRVGDVVGLDLGDPLVGDVAEAHRRVEGEPREDRHLRRCVGPPDVLGRVGLRVAELLRARQGLFVARTGRRHLREDEVGRPVDDPQHLLDPGRGQALLDHPDHRDDAGDGGLEAQLHPGLTGGGEELVAVLGDELLVRGDHVLARPQRPEHIVARRVGAAHQLDDDVRGGEDLVEVPLGSAQDAGELRPPAADRLHLEGAVGELLRKGAADGAEPQQTNSRRLTHRAPSGLRRSRGGRRRGRRRRGRRPPAGGGRRCSWRPSRSRRPRSPG